MNRINLDQLTTFLSVVRLGGVRKAAVGLNVTQPAVTARVKNLEEALCCELFERTAGGMRLTKRGELLLAHAEKFEYLAEQVERDVVDPDGVERRLRLGVSETIAQCWLPDLVTVLHQHYPNLEIEFNVDISINLRASLLNREIDLGILLGPVSDYSVNNIELPGFELAWYSAVSLGDSVVDSLSSSQPVITYARHTRPYREIKALLFEYVGPNVPMFPSSSLSACFRLVEANLGVGALPRALGDSYVADGRIREFDPGWLPEPLSFTASYLGEPKSHLVETAAQLACEVARVYDADKTRAPIRPTRYQR
ncbi:MAG: LysR family transcriptional regulator [Granulosicoccus sp.]